MCIRQLHGPCRCNTRQLHGQLQWAGVLQCVTVTVAERPAVTEYCISRERALEIYSCHCKLKIARSDDIEDTNRQHELKITTKVTGINARQGLGHRAGAEGGVVRGTGAWSAHDS